MSSGQANSPWFLRKRATWMLWVLSALFIGTWLAGKLFRWPWPDGADWQAIWTFFTFLIAAIAASVALAQLKAHYEAQRDQSRPYVIVDFSFRSVLMSIEVKNIGLTPARDVKLTWDILPSAMDQVQTEALRRNLVANSIAFLAPGRAIRYSVGRAPDYLADSSKPKRYEVAVSYSNASGELFGEGERMILDLGQWAEALADTDYDNKNWNQFKWQTDAQKQIAVVLGRVDGRLEGLETSATIIGDELSAMREGQRKRLVQARRR